MPLYFSLLSAVDARALIHTAAVLLITSCISHRAVRFQSMRSKAVTKQSFLLQANAYTVSVHSIGL